MLLPQNNTLATQKKSFPIIHRCNAMLLILNWFEALKKGAGKSIVLGEQFQKLPIET